MNVRGFFKNVLASDQTTGTAIDPEGQQTGGGMSGFLSGTSKFLDTMQSKKNGLFNDLSTKLGGIKLPGGDVVGGKKKEKSRQTEGDDESSASEYGDEGDKPMYAEQPPMERLQSVESVDSLPETEAEQCRFDIRTLVTQILQGDPVSSDMKASFQNYAMHHTGRSAFAKELKRQTSTRKEIPSTVLNDIGHYASDVLVHCNENDDFAPATQLMQASFTLYHEIKAQHMNDRCEQHYLFTLLRDQPIWQSTRFWNAAFFIALQEERRKETVPAGLKDEDALLAEKELQENAAFVQISKFVWRMRAFGISREACLEFLRKQASAEDLSKETCRTLQKNLQKLFEVEEVSSQ